MLLVASARISSVEAETLPALPLLLLLEPIHLLLWVVNKTHLIHLAALMGLSKRVTTHSEATQVAVVVLALLPIPLEGCQMAKCPIKVMLVNNSNSSNRRKHPCVALFSHRGFADMHLTASGTKSRNAETFAGRSFQRDGRDGRWWSAAAAEHGHATASFPAAAGYELTTPAAEHASAAAGHAAPLGRHAAAAATARRKSVQPPAVRNATAATADATAVRSPLCSAAGSVSGNAANATATTVWWLPRATAAAARTAAIHAARYEC